MLEAGTRARLCLIDAPAGSGKTTLLARWCLAGEASRRVAWVSLDESDDDPVRFWVYIIEAFRVVAPGFGEAPLGLLQGSGSADVALACALLAPETAGRPLEAVPRHHPQRVTDPARDRPRRR